MTRLPTLLLAPMLTIAPVLSAQTAGEPTSERLRDGINGAPPRADDAPPSDSPVGWRVGFSADGRPQRWERGDDAASELPLRLSVDREAPQVRLRFDGPQVSCGDATCITASTRLGADGSDASGISSLQLLVDGTLWISLTDTLAGLADGPHLLAIDARDALGNAARRAEQTIEIDTTPPTLGWERVDAIESVASDVFDGRRARLRIRVEDGGAGVAQLQLGDERFDADRLGGDGLVVDVDADALRYTVTDRLGNAGSGEIALRVDREGPLLVATRNGEVVELQSVQLSRSDSIALRADDALSGVASACLEASIWYGRCRELPIDLVGITPGRYPLEFRATDRLGNRSLQRLMMEVLP